MIGILFALAIFGIFYAISAYVAAKIGEKRNRERAGFWLGLLLGHAGCLCALFLSPAPTSAATPSAPPPKKGRVCPLCGKLLDLYVRTCPACGDAAPLPR